MYLFVLQQTKRKLDDANKRLEFLYDKLREQTVSFVLLPPTPQSRMANDFIGAILLQYVADAHFFLWKCAPNPFIGSLHGFLRKQPVTVLGPTYLCRLYSVVFGVVS